jgi:divalent metal cation (Fe/Co/Zn/Cd) transporter
MKEKIKIIQTIHLFMVMSLLFAYYFIGEFNSLDKFKIPAIDDSSVPMLLIPAFAIAVNFILFQYKVKQIDTTKEFEEYYVEYQSALIIRFALLEGVAFLILFMLPEYQIFGFIIVIYLLFLRLTINRMKNDLHVF